MPHTTLILAVVAALASAAPALAVAVAEEAPATEKPAADESRPMPLGKAAKTAKTDAQPAGGKPAEEPAADAKPLSVDEIVRRTNLAAYYQGGDGKAAVKMTIYDSAEDAKKQRNPRTREFTILRKNVAEGGDQYFYVYFASPPDVRKMVYRVWKHVGEKDDDRWLYLPALDLVKRVAAGDKRTSFVGSHFVYEDVSGRNIDADAHELLETTDKHYVLKNMPKQPKEVEFTWFKMWIDRKTFLPMRTEYYNDEGKVTREMSVDEKDVKIIDSKYPTVMKARMKNLETGGETVNEFTEVKYGLGLEDNIFKQERYLRRAPREVR